MPKMRSFRCSDCGTEWKMGAGSGESGQEMECPNCGGMDIFRALPISRKGRLRGEGMQVRTRGKGRKSA